MVRKKVIMMEKAMTITYALYDNIYVNLTNRCSNDCVFCERHYGPTVNGRDNLWLEHEPTVSEIENSLSEWDLTAKKEVVFCGYGEPTERLYDMLEVCDWLKKNRTIPIRLNTNGLADLRYQKHTAPLLKDRVDTVSISLNAVDADQYEKICRPVFGHASFDALLAYAKECTSYVPHVILSVVDKVTTAEQQKKAAEIAASCGAVLRVRPFEEDPRLHESQEN
jgi:TatD family-associated radical SAM protein